MTTFNDSLTRIRRFLRDTNGDIWDDAQIMRYWNHVQADLAVKTGILEHAEAYRYPPRYTWGYMWDWEWQYTEGDRLQVLLQWQASGEVVCYPWEAGYWLENSETPDDGYRMTQPWESGYGDPADPIPIPLNSRMHKAKLVAFDEEQVEPALQRELANSDPHYKTAEGSPTHYYLIDGERMQFCLYPRPSVVWDDPDLADTLTDTGGINVWTEGILDTGDGAGIITDEIATEDALFALYTAIPYDVQDYSDTLEWPEWLVHYVEAGVLERAFGADTDGFIPSLRDYWKMRREVGLKMIQRFQRMKQSNRDYRLGGATKVTRSRGGRLPSGYPAI